jgi:hypothetical protein
MRAPSGESTPPTGTPPEPSPDTGCGAAGNVGDSEVGMPCRLQRASYRLRSFRSTSRSSGEVIATINDPCRRASEITKPTANWCIVGISPRDQHHGGRSSKSLRNVDADNSTIHPIARQLQAIDVISERRVPQLVPLSNRSLPHLARTPLSLCHRHQRLPPAHARRVHRSSQTRIAHGRCRLSP